MKINKENGKAKTIEIRGEVFPVSNGFEFKVVTNEDLQERYEDRGWLRVNRGRSGRKIVETSSGKSFPSITKAAEFFGIKSKNSIYQALVRKDGAFGSRGLFFAAKV